MTTQSVVSKPLSQQQRPTPPLPRSQPKPIPVPTSNSHQRYKYKHGDQNTLSPDEVTLVAGKYMTGSHKEVDPIPELQALNLKTATPLVCALTRGIESLGEDFHGLTKDNINDIVEDISLALEHNDKRGIYTHTKDLISLPRTIRYNHTKKAAYIYLKTKGGLHVAKGGYRRGTRAIRIRWTNPKNKAEKITVIGVEKVFQLVTHDEKHKSIIAHKEPLDQRVKKVFSEQEFKDILSVLICNYEFFSYEKVKKCAPGEIPEKIHKSCMIAPFYTSSMQDMKASKLFTSTEIIVLAYDILTQLSALHHFGIIHGDVKAGNMLVKDECHTLLADYDFATILSRGETPCWRQGFYGTYSYTSPELLKQRFSNEKLDQQYLSKTDLYALGIELYEMTFGTLTPWHISLKFFRDTGAQSQDLAENIIKAQNNIIQQLDEHIVTYNKISNRSEDDKSNKVFLMHLIRDLIHPNPIIRV
ncbi:MAG: protein kinase, partial [Chlamydiales bacterium]|nr:protein kinase [Chlamydiales bacterium]